MLAAFHPGCIRGICSQTVMRPLTLSQITPASPRHSTLAQVPVVFFTRFITTTTSFLKDSKISVASSGIKRTEIPKKRIRWTDDETQLLRRLYADDRYNTTAELLAAFPNRTLRSIRKKIFLLKLSTYRLSWKQDEIDKLKALEALGVEPIEMVKSFKHRTHTSILQRLAIIRPPSPVRKVSPAILVTSSNDYTGIIERKPVLHKRFWTAQEDEVLRQLVQKAKEARPDRWKMELTRLMSNAENRQGLSSGRNAVTAVRRLYSLDRGNQTHLILGLWTAEEDKLLSNAVSAQLGPNFYPIIDLALTADTSKNKGDQESLGRRKGRPQKHYLTPYSKELRKMDWARVAEQVGSRDQYSCRKRFLSKMTNRHLGMWTDEEFKQMKEYLVKYGEDWRKISEALGTRTPAQIKDKYDRAFFSL